jgi:hypothetical protein
MQRPREAETVKLVDADLEDCSDVATSQGMLAATRSWDRPQTDSL